MFVSCILDFLLHDVTQHEVDNNKWPTGSLITDFANEQVNFFPAEWMTTCYEQRCQLLFEIYNTCYLVLCCKMIGKSVILHRLSERSLVQRPIEFERLLIGYISKCKDRLSISILASISQP